MPQGLIVTAAVVAGLIVVSTLGFLLFGGGEPTLTPPPTQQGAQTQKIPQAREVREFELPGATVFTAPEETKQKNAAAPTASQTSQAGINPSLVTEPVPAKNLEEFSKIQQRIKRETTLRQKEISEMNSLQPAGVRNNVLDILNAEQVLSNFFSVSEGNFILNELKKFIASSTATTTE